MMLVMGESGEIGIQKETYLAWPEVIPLFLPTLDPSTFWWPNLSNLRIV
jgi:hypothetical protein